MHGEFFLAAWLTPWHGAGKLCEMVGQASCRDRPVNADQYSCRLVTAGCLTPYSSAIPRDIGQWRPSSPCGVACLCQCALG